MSIPSTVLRTPPWKRSATCNLRILWLLVLLVSLTVAGCGGGDAVAGAETHPAGGPAASTWNKTSSIAEARSEPLIPEELGTLEKRYGGDSGPPVVFVIGESHVNLEVQQAVAKTLEYLRGAFGVKVIASEGFAGSLPLPSRFGPESGRYATAMAEFLDRTINAVELMALAYPDIEVYGVSDMEAYLRHGEVLDNVTRRFEDWARKFQDFVEKEVATLRVSERDGKRIVEALRTGLESGDLSDFTRLLCGVVGSGTSRCRNAKALTEERDELGRLQDATVSPDHSLMKRRDQALVANTLQLSDKGPVALIVGYFHLPGVERELESQKVAYWAIAPPGVKEPVQTKEDEEAWDRWTKKTPTVFEKWMERNRHKPEPALTRAGFRRQVEIFNALALTDHLLLAGQGEQEVIQLLRQGDLPEDFAVQHCFQIKGGHGIQFTAAGKTGYAYFTEGPPPDAPGYEELKRGELPGGRSLVIYGGGSGKPPVGGPPIGVSGHGGPEDRDPFRPIIIAIDKQEKENPKAVTVAFQVDGNRLFRLVNKRVRVLPVSPAWIKERRSRLDEFPPTRRKLLAALELANLLLLDIEGDLPSGEHSVLYQLSEPDLLGSYSLVTLAELSDHPSAGRLRDFTEVYWSEPDNPELEEVLSTPSRPVEIKKTVVWIADQLRNDPGYDQLVETIEESGARVNLPVEEEETLFLVGSPGVGWNVTLQNGGSRRAETRELHRELGEASAVVTIGAALSEKDRSFLRSYHGIEVTAEQVLEAGRHWIEATARESGRMPLNQVLRQKTSEKTVEIRDLLANDGDSKSVQEVSYLVSENAMERRQT